MYATKDRFSKGLNANTAFQKEEKDKNKNVDLAHLESIRKYAKNLAERVDNQIFENDKKLDHRLKMKGIAQWSYEHVILFILIYNLIIGFPKFCIFLYFYK